MLGVKKASYISIIFIWHHSDFVPELLIDKLQRNRQIIKKNGCLNSPGGKETVFNRLLRVKSINTLKFEDKNVGKQNVKPCICLKEASLF